MKVLLRFLPAGWLLMLLSAGISAQTITSFSPASASVGSTVVITGTGFNSTPANNKVWFGTIPATVTVASATSLSVTVPASAPFAPISVKVAGSGSAVSSHPFSLKAQAGELQAGGFQPDETIAVLSNEPTLIDVNQDGKLDLLLPDPFVPGGGTKNIGYYRNTSSPGDISFAGRMDLPVGTWGADRIVTGDLDLDGKLDYVLVGDFVRLFRDVGDAANPNLQLWKEIFNPDMTGGYWRKETTNSSNLLHMAVGLLDYDPFSVFDTYPSSSVVWVPSYITHMKSLDAVIRDFDGDGRLDIAVAYRGTYDSGIDGRIRIFLNKVIPFLNTIEFQLWVDLEIREPYNNRLDGYSLTAGDINGDGRTDLAVAGHIYPYAMGMVSFIMNLPSGFVTSSWVLPARTERLVLADFDGDSKLDVAYQMFTGFEQNISLEKIVVARNLSTADSLVFQQATEFPFLGRAGLQVADFDGDGRPDLLWPCDGCSGLAAVRNTGSPGTISFSPSMTFLHNLLSINALAAGDLDGDGKPDVVAVESEVSVIRNTIPSYSLSQSLVTVGDPSIPKNGSTTISLQLKDALGNDVDGAGLSVAFSLTGSGTSSGTFGPATYQGAGVYSADFTGTNVGTASDVLATLEGSPVTSTPPTITVAAGSHAVAQSTVTISRSVVTAGATATVTYQARDANGDSLTTGGLTGITFFLSGSGTSSGDFGSVSDDGNGKYTCIFSASTSGTTNTIGALINTDTIKTTFADVTVQAGVFSTSTSVMTFSSSTMYLNDTVTATLQIKDESGNNVTTGGLNVKFELLGDNPYADGRVYLLNVVDHQDGTYSTGIVAYALKEGTSPVRVYIWNPNPGYQVYQQVFSFPTPITVEPRPVSLAHSTVEWWNSPGDSTIFLDVETASLTLAARNDLGEPYTASNLTVAFTLASDGTATFAQLESAHYDGNGLYRANYKGTGVGTPRTLSAIIGGQPVTTAPLRIAVVPFGISYSYPHHDQTDVPVDTTFYWTSASGATSYRVIVVADSLNGQPVVDTSGVTATSLQVKLAHSRRHYWWVTSYYQDLEGQKTATVGFTTSQGSPQLLAPFDREANVALPAVFRWLPAPGAETYRLQVANDTGFLSLLYDGSGLTDTSVTIPGLSPGTKYYWRVNASTAGSTSDYADFRSFTTSFVPAPQTIYFVSTLGNDNASGTSWGEAFATLQRALTVSSSGDEIWVSAGTYKPTTTTDRAASFVLKNGVAVFGGFAGTESARSQRNWELNPTILSGDIDSDGTLANNSYHVVVANTFATGLLDGFTITGGNGGAHGGGIYSSGGYATLSNLVISGNATEYGGGMYNAIGNPTLFNVTFSGNTAAGYGGGFYNILGHPRITNTTFVGNSASVGGGGFANETPGNPAPHASNPVLTNVVFKNNTADFGSGMYTSNGDAILRNVLFHENSGDFGGGLYNFSGDLVLTNVTFSYNSSGWLGGGMYTIVASNVVMKNVIFWGNTADQLYLNQSTATLYNCLIDGGIGGAGVVKVGGTVIDSSGNIDADPLFLDVGAGDLRLTSGSPALDAGLNEAVVVRRDLDGLPRISGGVVDLGAYEFQSATATESEEVTVSDSLYNLGTTNTGVTFDFIPPDKTVYLFSSYYPSAPDSISFDGPAPPFVSDFRWIFAKTGDYFSGATLTLENVSTLPGMADPATVSIYRRPVHGSGPFEALTTTYDASNDRLSASIPGFSEFIIAGEDNPLPVQLATFTATANRTNAELRWRTESEVENYGFEIERRVTNQRQNEPTNQSPDSQFTIHDSQSWVVVGFVSGSGTSSSPRDYAFVDKPDQPGRYAYRIKQIDLSGAFTYTAALEVVVGVAPLEFTLSQNYPNPFNPTTTIEFTLPADGHVVLKVYDLVGREVATLADQEMKAGVYQQVVFDASRLASGLYFVRIQSEGRFLIKKMLLVR